MGRSDKKAKRAVETKGIKGAVPSIKPGSYYGLSPTFSFRKYDAEAPWAVSADGRPTVDRVFKMLSGIELSTWGEIRQASGGRSHGTNSHPISIREMASEAQNRAADIALLEDELFSLRLTSTVRLWGVIEPSKGCFFVIWYDPNHSICPIDK